MPGLRLVAAFLDQTLFLRADKSDAPEILALQKIAYQSEAELYGDDSLPAMHQTLQDLETDFERVPDRVAVLANGPHTPGNGHPEADRIVFLKDGIIVDETPLNGKSILAAGEKVAVR